MFVQVGGGRESGAYTVQFDFLFFFFSTQYTDRRRRYILLFYKTTIMIYDNMTYCRLVRSPHF